MSNLTKTIPWAARATVLGAVLLAAAACPSCATHVVVNRPGQPENALVWLEKVDDKFVVKIDKDPIPLRELKDWAQWISPQGYEVGVDFKTESPFIAPPILTPNRILKSAPPKRGTAGKHYDYTVTLKVGVDSKYSLDPRIEVVDH